MAKIYDLWNESLDKRKLRGLVIINSGLLFIVSDVINKSQNMTFSKFSVK